MRGFALTLAVFLATTACGDEERLEGLHDACLERASGLEREFDECSGELESAQSVVMGDEAPPPTGGPTPLLPVRARIHSRPGTTARLEFDARSYSDEPIESFKFRVRIFNAFEELIPCEHEDEDRPRARRRDDDEVEEEPPATTCVTGAQEMLDEEERTIAPRQTHRVARSLPDHDRATKAIVTIHEVVLEGGGTWHGAAVGFPAPRITRSQDEEDTDSDDVNDEEDRCPDDPEDLDEFEDEDGCPEEGGGVAARRRG